jgi:ABC-type nitrate/sulfonate/bicarbonate transport system substrate-binding protein
MMEIPNTDEIKNPSPAVAALRAQLMDGLCDVDTLAEALNKTKRQVQNYIREGLPVVYIGRNPFPVVSKARDWLISRRDQKHAA